MKHIIKKSIAVLLTLVMTIGLIPVGVFANTANTADGFIPITNGLELNAIRNNLDGNFRLMNDIDLAGVAWEPIGGWGAQFTGVFDGNGHTIRNLNINLPTRDYVGLFGYSKGLIKDLALDNVNVNGQFIVGSLAGFNSGYIRNVTVTNAHISAFSIAGGLVGTNSLGNIYNAHVSDSPSITGGSACVGGIAAQNVDGVISRSSVTNIGEIRTTSAWGQVGGIVGTNTSRSTIEYSFTSGVAALGVDNFKVGGIAGIQNFSTIRMSYSTNDVGGIMNADVMNAYWGLGLGMQHTGGLVGHMRFGTIEQSFATGNVAAVIGDSGGLVGMIVDSGTIRNSFSTGNVALTPNSAGFAGNIGTPMPGFAIRIENSYSLSDNPNGFATGGTITNSFFELDRITNPSAAAVNSPQARTAVQMKQQGTFTDWDFDTIWIMESGEYPRLRGLTNPFGDDGNGGGNGGENGFFLVGSPLGRFEGGGEFITDQLIARVHRGVTYEEVAQAVATIDGEILRVAPHGRRYTIQVPVNTEAGLRNLMDVLMNTYPHIFYRVGFHMVDGLASPAQSNEALSPSPNEGGGAAQAYFQLLSRNPTNERTNFWTSNDSWNLRAINAPAAWAILEKNNITQRTKVGIADTAFMYNHEDLRIPGANVRNLADTQIVFRDEDNATPLERRDLLLGRFDHGTGVMSTAGAIHNNGLGLAGVMNINRNNLYGIDIFNTTGRAYEFGNRVLGVRTEREHQWDALYNFTSNNIRVINFSVGGTTTEPDPEFETEMRTLLEDSNRDFLIIHAAGNDATDARLNGSWAHVSDSALRERIITVGAVYAQDMGNPQTFRMTNFTNYGSRIDLVSPGHHIYSAARGVIPNAPHFGYEDFFFSDYRHPDGTSMSAPHVASAAAMVMDANQNLSAPQVREIIIDSARYSSILRNKVVTEHRTTVQVAGGSRTISANYRDAQYYMLCVLSAVQLALGRSIFRVDAALISSNDGGGFPEAEFVLSYTEDSENAGEVVAFGFGNSDEYGRITLIGYTTFAEGVYTKDLILNVYIEDFDNISKVITVEKHEITKVSVDFGCETRGTITGLVTAGLPPGSEGTGRTLPRATVQLLQYVAIDQLVTVREVSTGTHTEGRAGMFTIRGIVPAEYFIRVTYPNDYFLPLTSGPYSVSAGVGVEPLHLNLEMIPSGDGSWTGELLAGMDFFSAPIDFDSPYSGFELPVQLSVYNPILVDVKLEFRPLVFIFGIPTFIPGPVVKTDYFVNGRFDVTLPAGRYIVTASAEGFITRTIPVDIFGGMVISENIVLQRDPDFEREFDFVIENEADLLYMTYQISQGGMINGVPAASARYRLAADLDMSGYADFIGIGSWYNQFMGEFYGGGHSIRLRIERITRGWASYGLFRETNGATISHLIVEGSVYVHADGGIGGLVGRAFSTTISNVENRAEITVRPLMVSFAHVGGIAGSISGSIVDSVNIGNVRVIGPMGTATIGGIVGQAAGSQITRTVSYGDVSGHAHSIGGIVGSAHNHTRINDVEVGFGSTIHGTFGGTTRVGGIVGAMSSSFVTNTRMNGNVISGRRSPTQNTTGGIAGHASSSTITDNEIWGNITGYFHANSTVGNVFGLLNIIERNIFHGNIIILTPDFNLRMLLDDIYNPENYIHIAHALERPDFLAAVRSIIHIPYGYEYDVWNIKELLLSSIDITGLLDMRHFADLTIRDVSLNEMVYVDVLNNHFLLVLNISYSPLSSDIISSFDIPWVIH